eukprot:GHUV01024211.1.p1 GENE.GHUV01024211.1~~GHUV01024211.1.p1  ORF type:complete len:181 (+),score=60.26 GHUV01024211.1:982-1524(+)
MSSRCGPMFELQHALQFASAWPLSCVSPTYMRLSVELFCWGPATLGLILMYCRAIEAVGLAAPGQAGNYIQQQYQRLLGPLEQQQWGQQPSSLPQPQQQQQQAVWPVNTHGGLLGFGAPWEVPAMHSLIEAVTQLREEAVGRQVPGAKRALVYGNGGVFSASAVAILERQQQRQQQPSKL